jgi:DNA-3-methyladenine glycosylase II
MWFNAPRVPPDWAQAQEHLRRADPALGPIIARVGPCLLTPRRDHFVALCQSIFTQQISTAVATVLFARFREQFPARRPTPQRVLQLLEGDDEAIIRACGLSRQKRLYLIDLARHFEQQTINRRGFGRMDDERIIEQLTRVKGVGRWTAEMFLIFVLNRPDVLPVDDLGLRKGMQKLRRLRRLPDAAECRWIAEAWRPWRSVGTWYLWRGG